MKTNISKNRLFIIAVTGLFFVILFTNFSRATAAEPINIGVTCDFSGVTSREGNVIGPSFEMAVKDINERGGINGRPVKLFVLDNGSDLGKVVGTLKVLKEMNKCVAALYGVTSAGGLAAKAWAEQNHMPIITSGPSTDRLTQVEGRAWFFKSNSTATEGMNVDLARIKKLGYKRVGLMGSTQALGTDMLSSVKENAPRFGLELVGSVLCEPKSKDLTIQAITLKKTNPEAIIAANYPGELGVWARNVKSIGWQPYTNVTSSQLLYAVIESSPPELVEGWEGHALVDFNKPAVKMTYDKFKTYTNKDRRENLIPLTWDAAHLLFEAIRISGDPDNPEAIRDGFYKIKNFPIVSGCPGAMGSFKIGRNYVITFEDMSVVVIKSGKVVAATE